jgi:hypothetical protein
MKLDSEEPFSSDALFMRQPPRDCIILGQNVPMPDRDGTTRIGCGDVYLEIASDGKVRMVGAEGDEAVHTVLEGLQTMLVGLLCMGMPADVQPWQVGLLKFTKLGIVEE